MKSKAAESDADKIKQANYVNVVKKLKAGKTLTAQDQKIVDEYQGADEHLETKVDLAARCQIGRKALDRFLNLPGAPKRTAAGWPVQKITQWILANTRRSDVGVKLDGKFQAAKLSEVTERARRIKIRNDRDDGILISRAQHEAVILQHANAVQTILASLPQKAVELVGLTVPEAEKRLQGAVNECLLALRNSP